MRRVLGVALAALAAACAAPPAATVTAPAAAPVDPNAIALRNPGFEAPPRQGERCSAGWECAMHAGATSFRFALETQGPGAGRQSFCVERVEPEPWAIATQSIDGPAVKGARLRLSLLVRGHGLDGRGAGPYIRVHGLQRSTAAHGQRPVVAGARWQREALELDVPEDARLVEVGMIIEGGGRACFDDVRLERVAAKP